MSEFVNYHKHTCYSNIFSQDSTASIEEYIKKIKELNQKTLVTTEHGWAGNTFAYHFLSSNNNLKCVFGVEAYWVKNNKEKDNSNCHIILLAKTNKGRRQINRLTSYANLEGYYYRPRISIDDLFSISKEDIMITTACVGFNKYGLEYSEEIILKLKEHFKDSFYLEIQYHDTEIQKKWNKFLYNLNKKYSIQMIVGLDSHYINETDSKERDIYLEVNGVRYADEEGWYMDFPNEDEIIKRFNLQDIIPKEEVLKAIQNTYQINNFENIDYDFEIKLPTIYPNLTQEEKDEKLLNILRKEFKNKKIEKEDINTYAEEIKKEFKVIKDTGFSDYFLFNYEMIKKGKEYGGQLTLTGRGSAPSYYLNNLLGFTTIDRIKAPVLMYPERFATTERILESKSLFDIDFNVADTKPFEKAQKELLGENKVYWMLKYGKLKEKSAFKMYAKANDIPFELSNEIVKKIDEYNKVVKYIEDEEEKELISIYDYIGEEYREIYDESLKYQGIIQNASISPCSFLLYNKDIIEEIGVIKLKENVCCCIDGKYSDIYKYLKND